MPSLGTRTARGLLWAYGSYVGGRLLVLVSTAILARLLAPREFGLVATALIAITLLQTASDLGVTQALILGDEEQALARADTAFGFSVLLGIGLTGATAAISPLVAAFFHEPAVGVLLPVLGLNFLISSLGATHYALAQKRIEFRSRTFAEFAEVIVRGITGIALAVAGFGAWSLVLAGAGMATVLVVAVHTFESPGLLLAIGGVLGSASYVAILWLVAPQALIDLWRRLVPAQPATAG